MKSGAVVEHLGDLGAESRDYGRVEERIKSCKNDSADNHTDDDLDTGVDVAFACLGGKGGLGGSADGVYLVTDRMANLNLFLLFIIVLVTFLFLRFDFCLDYIFCTGASSDGVGADSTAADWCCFRALSYSWEISPTRAALEPAVMG